MLLWDCRMQPEEGHMNKKRYCVIGDPVAHSRSPMLFEEIFGEMRRQGRAEPDTEYTYDIKRIETEKELESFFLDMKKGLYVGCNVTMPWKTRSDLFVDEPSPTASVIGAVNTVAVRDGVIRGHSTDGDGMLYALSQAGAVLPAEHMVLLGAGGAARSILAACIAKRAAGRITVIARPGANLDRLWTVIDRMREQVDALPDITVLDSFDERTIEGAVERADILINATPIGMGEDRSSTPVPASYLHSGLTVADAVYEPMETRLIREARAAGCRAVPGVEMLKGQAIESARFFGLL